MLLFFYHKVNAVALGEPPGEKGRVPDGNLRLTRPGAHDIMYKLVLRGEMAERLMALVLKTSDTERYRGFESLSLRHGFIMQKPAAEAAGRLSKAPVGAAGRGSIRPRLST